MSESQIIRTLIGASCVIAFSFHAFSYTGSTADKASELTATAASAAPAYRMPTARDYAFFERRLRKASNEGRFAESCAHGQAVGNTTVYVAMQFPALNHRATKETPGFARAHVDRTDGTPKALVLDSHRPTLWNITGSPSVIVLLGEAVVAEYPKTAKIFAPRMASHCRSGWERHPSTWSAPTQESHLSSLVGDIKNKYDKRAKMLSRRLFEKPFTGWEVRRGDSTFKF